MRPYLSITAARFRTLIQYRAAAIAGVATQVFWGLIRVMIFEAFYRSSSAPQPMTYPQVVTYIWLGQAMLLLTMLYAEPEITALIRSGGVAYELARPVDLYAAWYARCFSGVAARLLMRCLPILLLASFIGLLPPASPSAALLFLVSLSLALMLAASIVTLITISLLWTISGEGISRLAPAAIYFFSGMIIPLPLLPGWLQPALSALPFRGLIDVPFRIYLAHLSPRETAVALAQQVAWIVALIVVGRLLLARGKSRLVVQGG